MRKKQRIFLISMIVMILAGSFTVQGAQNVNVSKTKPIGIYQEKVYKCDLNGDGKKEKIQLKGTGDWRKAKLYINSKKVLDVWYPGRNFECFVNVNRKDKYHEIFVADTLYRYNGKTLKKYAKGNYTSWASGHVRSTPGNGTINYTGCIHDYSGNTMDNIFYEVYPTVELNMTVKGGKIKINSNKVHKIVDDNYTWLKKSIRVTTKAGSGKAFTISKWRDVVLTSYKYGSKYSYIQVKDRKNGKKGWYKVKTSMVRPMGAWE